MTGEEAGNTSWGVTSCPQVLWVTWEVAVGSDQLWQTGFLSPPWVFLFLCSLLLLWLPQAFLHHSSFLAWPLSAWSIQCVSGTPLIIQFISTFHENFYLAFSLPHPGFGPMIAEVVRLQLTFSTRFVILSCSDCSACVGSLLKARAVCLCWISPLLVAGLVETLVSRHCSQTAECWCLGKMLKNGKVTLADWGKSHRIIIWGRFLNFKSTKWLHFGVFLIYKRVGVIVDCLSIPTQP